MISIFCSVSCSCTLAACKHTFLIGQRNRIVITGPSNQLPTILISFNDRPYAITTHIQWIYKHVCMHKVLTQSHRVLPPILFYATDKSLDLVCSATRDNIMLPVFFFFSFSILIWFFYSFLRSEESVEVSLLSIINRCSY